MFTGIIEAVATVVSRHGSQLALNAGDAYGADPFVLGESVAVNGCCLTVVADAPLTFDLSEETWNRTSLGALAVGDRVNLERAMRAGGRFGGHVVQGHVDATAEILSVEPTDAATVLRFRVPDGGGRYLIDKGSVTLDGISLTVVRPEGDTFEVWIIPHTWANTTLRDRRPEDRVNLEYDVIAKYVERLLRRD